jgi:uracil-DNA glycosylase
MSCPDGPCCADCPQSAFGQRFIGPDGCGANGVLLVGDSPWVDEIAAGRVFSGAAGRLLDRMLGLLGVAREDFTIANTIWCRPLRLGWMDKAHKIREAAAAIAHCAPHLDQLIEERQPRVIVPMGNVALRRICGVSGIEERAGYVHSTPYGVPAVPTFHPSYLLRGKQNLVPVVLWALQRALQISAEGFRPYEYQLLVDPARDDLQKYVASAPTRIPTLFVDIETPESTHLDEEELEEAGPSYTIVRAGFALRQGEAVSFPFEPPYIDILRNVLERADEVVEWADNRYDTRRLHAAGLPIPPRIVSGMWAWHWLQSDLAKGLAKVAPFFYNGPPWKHLSAAEPGRYNALDNAVGMDCYLGIRKALEEQGRWGAFVEHCVEMVPMLEAMGKRGLRIDRAYQGEFMSQLEREWDAENAAVQVLVPEHLKPHKYWKRPPRDMRGVSNLEHQVSVIRERVCSSDPNTLHQAMLREQDEAQEAYEFGYRYVRVDEFNVDSWQQVQALAKHLGISLPARQTASETDEEALATDRKTLSRYVKKYPVFAHILRCRERWKLISTYKWPLTTTDRVQYVLGFHPSTWRLSCRKQNLQTIPKRSDLAKRFRRMIVASPEHLLVEADAAAIEAVLVGHFAGSERYMRLARCGVHGWLTSAFHGQPLPLDWPATELSQRCKAAKKLWPEDYEKLKRVVHLSNYLGTKRRIREEYPDDFATEKEAGQLQQFYLDSLPGTDVRAWQRATVEQAHAAKALENSFGLRHRFYNLWTYNPRRRAFEFGDDAKRAVAFRPQSAAAAIQRLVLRALSSRLPDALAWLCLPVHDALIADVPCARVDEYAQVLYEVMTAPVAALGGLVIGAEVTVGQNAAPFDAEENPGGMQPWSPVSVA